ncbi:hypothetical protein [Peribacillus butanolivorans]
MNLQKKEYLAKSRISQLRTKLFENGGDSQRVLDKEMASRTYTT